MSPNLIILIKNSKCSCTKCGRTANDKKRLCKPKKLRKPLRFVSK